MVPSDFDGQSMISRAFFLLLVWMTAEAYLLLRFGRAFGLDRVLLVMAVTAIAGVWLARREGMGVLARLRSTVSEGRTPGAELLDGAIIFLSAVLLVLPGLIGDLVGLAGLLPFSRPMVRKALARRVVPGSSGSFFFGYRATSSQASEPTEPVVRRQVETPYTTTFGGTPRERPSHTSEEQ